MKYKLKNKEIELTDEEVKRSQLPDFLGAFLGVLGFVITVIVVWNFCMVLHHLLA